MNLPVSFGVNFDQVRNGEILKFVDGRWSPRGGPELPHGTKMLFGGMLKALQHWEFQALIDEIVEKPGEHLPSAKKLNAEIPQSEWEPGLDGKPRPPWALYYVFYLINDEDGCAFYHSNCTWGQMLAYHELENKLAIDEVKGLRGIPILELHSKLMPTPKGPKQRPHYRVADYFGDGMAQVARGPRPTIEDHGQPEPIVEIEEDDQAQPSAPVGRVPQDGAAKRSGRQSDAKPAKGTNPAPWNDDDEPDVRAGTYGNDS
jgi:hypothetical protein